MKQADTFDAQYHPDFYTKRIEENGIEETERYVYGLSEGSKKRLAGELAIAKYYKEQEDIRNGLRDEREEKTLGLAREANDISRGSNSLATAAICLSIIAIVVSIFVAFV